MEGIKATIKGKGVDSSVEFSLEELIARHQGKPWAEMNDDDRDEAMKDYALSLFSRQNGQVSDDDLSVDLERGTFSNTRGTDV
jgi:hypothetical protein